MLAKAWHGEVVWLSPLLENGIDWLLCKVASVLNLETSGGAYESLAQVSEMIFQGSPLALALPGPVLTKLAYQARQSRPRNQEPTLSHLSKLVHEGSIGHLLVITPHMRTLLTRVTPPPAAYPTDPSPLGAEGASSETILANPPPLPGSDPGAIRA